MNRHGLVRIWHKRNQASGYSQGALEGWERPAKSQPLMASLRHNNKGASKEHPDHPTALGTGCGVYRKTAAGKAGGRMWPRAREKDRFGKHGQDSLAFEETV